MDNKIRYDGVINCAISVSSLDKALRWYGDVLGFPLKQATDTLLVFEHAGADLVAPSDMMDGRVGAIREALQEEMRADESVFLLGEDIGAYGGAFKITEGFLDEFGPDRVIFASDWPVCTRGAALREWVLALQEIVDNRPISEQRKLFAENAIGFYGV